VGKDGSSTEVNLTIHLQLMPKFTMYVEKNLCFPYTLHGVNTENFTF